MANLVLHPGWHLPQPLVTPEKIFLNRRHFIQQMGLTGLGVLAASVTGCSQGEAVKSAPASSGKKFPAPRNPEFNPGWRLTNEKVAGSYNNFYEFSLEKDQVRLLTGALDEDDGVIHGEDVRV